MTVKELIKSLPPGGLDVEIEIDVGCGYYQPLSRVLQGQDDDGVETIMLIPECYRHD